MKRLLLLFLFFIGTGSLIANNSNPQPLKIHRSLRVKNKPRHTLTSHTHETELVAIDNQTNDNIDGGPENTASLVATDYTISPELYITQTDFNSLFLGSRSWQRSIAKRAPPALLNTSQNSAIGRFA